jgi:hypothetical protein
LTLLSKLTRLFVDTVQRVYAERSAAHGGARRDAKTGAAPTP